MKIIPAILLGASLCATAALPSCQSSGPRYDFAPADMLKTSQQARHDAAQWLFDNQKSDGSWGYAVANRLTGQGYNGGGNIAAHDAFKQASCAIAIQALINEWVSESQATEPDATYQSELQACLERALPWMLNQGVPARSSSDVFYNGWALTYKTELAAKILETEALHPWYDAAREMGQDSIDRLAAMQSLPGGWAYYDFDRNYNPENMVTPIGDHATTFMTSAVMVAIHKAQAQGLTCDTYVLERAAAFMHDQRTPYGSFVYGWGHRRVPEYNRLQGSIGRIAVGHLAMWRAGQADWVDAEAVATNDDLVDALDKFRLHRAQLLAAQGSPVPHSKMHQNAAYYVLFGHYYAAQLARVAQQEGDADAQAMGEQFSAWLLPEVIEMQEPVDGSFMDFPVYDYGHAYGTGYGLLILQQLDPAYMG